MLMTDYTAEFLNLEVENISDQLHIYIELPRRKHVCPCLGRRQTVCTTTAGRRSRIEAMDLPEFHDCTKAYHNWFQEILNSMDVPWANGYIEGCNNKTKVLKRVSYGMRNFSNFWKRILFCNT